MSDTLRVPPSAPQRTSWSLETAIDYLLSVIGEKNQHLLTLIAGNDKRYEERLTASQKALELGLAGLIREIQAALTAADRAVQKAEVATEKRFESINEFRGTLDNQQRTLITRTEVGVTVKGLEDKLANLEKLIDGLQSDHRSRTSERRGVAGGWGYAVGAIGLVLLVASFALKMMGR